MAVAVIPITVAISIRPLVGVVGEEVGVFTGDVVAIPVPVAVRPLAGLVWKRIGLVAVGVVPVAVFIGVEGLGGVVRESVHEVVHAVLVGVEVKIPYFCVQGPYADGEELAGELRNSGDDLTGGREGLKQREVGLIDKGGFPLLCTHDIHAVVAVDGHGLFGVAQAEAG